MFEVILVEDKLPLPYHHMKMDPSTQEITVDPQVLCDIITHKYNDTVLPNYGLLIDIFDIVKAYECKSLPDIPVAYVRCVFRYIVFNPPIGSVWTAKISGTNEDGISLQMSFFNDIWIPWANLPENTEYEAKTNTWRFIPNPDDDEDAEEAEYYFSEGSIVKFRVCEVKYNPDEKAGQLMVIIGSMSTNGLGPIAWWQPDEPAEAAE